MSGTRRHQTGLSLLPDDLREALSRRVSQAIGLLVLAISAGLALALVSWKADDPSLSHATSLVAKNWLGRPGAIMADLLIQIFGMAAITAVFVVAVWGWRMMTLRPIDREALRLPAWLAATLLTACTLSYWPAGSDWPLPSGLGGIVGDGGQWLHGALFGAKSGKMIKLAAASGFAFLALSAILIACGLFFKASPEVEEAPQVVMKAKIRGAAPPPPPEEDEEEENPSVLAGALAHARLAATSRLKNLAGKATVMARDAAADTPPAMPRREPRFVPPPAFDDEEDEAPPVRPRGYGAPMPAAPPEPRAYTPSPATSPTHQVPVDEPPFAMDDDEPDFTPPAPRKGPRIHQPVARVAPSQASLPLADPNGEDYELPSLDLLSEPKPSERQIQVSMEGLQENARMLEGVLEDFGVRGEIINVRPGPVVTLYELEPAPGIKSSRVIGLADDIARSMSAVSARVAVVPGRNVIGIELPNAKRQNVLLREMLASADFAHSKDKLPICLGKTIGGDPVVADLAKMPHLLVAGTTGSGKSVAVNTMILSLLFRFSPKECRLIMVDPKMLELSIYDGIPHLLSPVVTDPKKAVVALKWAVREMEDRYKKMSKVGVRNIDGFNTRLAQALAKGETIHRTVQTGFDRETGEAIYEQEEMDLNPLPYIVVIVDEMADLMMVAGKEIEGLIQRLAQMARAAGIHIITATQRPSVDVITGTIKANFPTRISFQVTSKIDSRTILGEQGAEQLLGRGDMLHMAGGGRISRVHGPFVSDEEVERVVAHLKIQGHPDYLDAITADEEEGGASGDDEGGGAVFDSGNFGEEPQGLYEQAVQVVMRDKKASTSYIQRRLQIGYNRAASLIERMEREGLVGPANHAGKREILVGEHAESEY